MHNDIVCLPMIIMKHEVCYNNYWSIVQAKVIQVYFSLLHTVTTDHTGSIYQLVVAATINRTAVVIIVVWL